MNSSKRSKKRLNESMLTKLIASRRKKKQKKTKIDVLVTSASEPDPFVASVLKSKPVFGALKPKILTKPKIERQNLVTKSSLWIYKHNERYYGNDYFGKRLKAALQRKFKLKHSTPVAIILRGFSGSGKMTLVRQVANELMATLNVFNVTDINSKSEFNNFYASLVAHGFSTKITVLQDVDKVGSFNNLRNLLQKLHGTSTKKKTRFPLASFPLIILAGKEYSKTIASVQKFCLTIDLPKPDFRKIIQRIALCENVDQNLVSTFLSNIHAVSDMSRTVNDFQMLCRFRNRPNACTFAHVVSENPRPPADIHVAFRNLRWPADDGKLMNFQSWITQYECCDQHAILQRFLPNFPDNRTTLDDMVYLTQNLSFCDALASPKYVSFFLRDAVRNVAIHGKKKKISFSSVLSQKRNPQLVAEAASYHRKTQTEILEIVSFMGTDGIFQPFDKMYAEQNETSLVEVRKMNCTLRLRYTL
jgi:hypothetical protein